MSSTRTKTAPAPVIKTVPLASLSPYLHNARTHSPEQIKQIADSIKEYGWTNPVLVDGQRGIIAGHGRAMAAKLLGMTDVPVIELRHLTPAQKRAYVLADNQMALNAGWDVELLQIEIGALHNDDFDLSLTGFDASQLAGFLTGMADEPIGDGSGIIADDTQGEWLGMPDYDQDKATFRTLFVHFSDQAGVDAFTALVEQAITPKTKYIWYPPVEREPLADQRYEAEIETEI